jgi:hypothetical protein
LRTIASTILFCTAALFIFRGKANKAAYFPRSTDSGFIVIVGLRRQYGVWHRLPYPPLSAATTGARALQTLHRTNARADCAARDAQKMVVETCHNGITPPRRGPLVCLHFVALLKFFMHKQNNLACYAGLGMRQPAYGCNVRAKRLTHFILNFLS